jgi:hypothetical protein
MKLNGLFVAICCGILLFAACKKSDDNKDNSNTTTTTPQSAIAKLLEAGKWEMSAETATLNYMGKDTTIDVYKDLQACEKDDFVLFIDNGTSTKDENTNVCTGKPQVMTITWALLNNDTRLALVDSNPDTFDLDLSSTQMKIKQTKPNSSNVPVTYLFTYKNIK